MCIYVVTQEGVTYYQYEGERINGPDHTIKRDPRETTYTTFVK